MAELNEGLLDKLKTAIKTSTAGAKARAAGDWFREKAKQASASAKMKAVTPNQLLKRQPDDNIQSGLRNYHIGICILWYFHLKKLQAGSMD